MGKAILTLYLFFHLSISFGQSTNPFISARAFIKEKNFFSAKACYIAERQNMSLREQLILKACLNNAFNQPSQSNKAISSLFKHYSHSIADTLNLEMLRLQQSNFARLYNYAKAYHVGKQILLEYSKILSSEESKDITNTLKIYKALQACPRQKVEIKQALTIKLQRDVAKLANITINSNGQFVDFIFDTGANFSTVTESTANNLKMKYLDEVIQVGSITGAEVSAHLAICPLFKMGDVNVENAVFLVFPDSALAFPQIKYQINGIIGFPVIEALKEIQITRNDELIVPKKRTSIETSNLALDFLTPVYSLGEEYYTFDTGAVKTMLYSKYYNDYKRDITASNTQVPITFGGAGGMRKYAGYIINFQPKIPDKFIDMKNIEVISEPFNDQKDNYFGNIGQDFIKQFDKMTLNFESMFLIFE